MAAGPGDGAPDCRLSSSWYEPRSLGIALCEVEHLLNEAELTDEQLARLQADVQTLDIQDSFTTSLIGERGVGLSRLPRVS